MKRFLTLRDKPELKEEAAEWFSSKWSVPKEAYLECMDAYLNHQTELGWYPVYLVTNHVGFYERYGWEFFCMVKGDGEPYLSRMYISK